MKNSQNNNAVQSSQNWEQKIPELETQIQNLQSELEIANQKQLRALADLENFRRRENENKKNWSKLAVAEFIKNALPSFLELSLGSEHSTDENVKKVVEKFMESLKTQGLEKIEPQKGERIDPEMHAVLMAEAGDSGTVVRTLEFGWKYQDLVLSPAKISGAQ